MPVHDWTKVRPGLFHDFHQRWSGRISDALNMGILPPDHYALVEQRSKGLEPDVIAVETGNDNRGERENSNTSETLKRPKTRLMKEFENDESYYARKANRVVIHHEIGRVVAMIEIVSPGNKGNRDQIE